MQLPAVCALPKSHKAKAVSMEKFHLGVTRALGQAAALAQTAFSFLFSEAHD